MLITQRTPSLQGTTTTTTTTTTPKVYLDTFLPSAAYIEALARVTATFRQDTFDKCGAKKSKIANELTMTFASAVVRCAFHDAGA